MAGSLGTLTLNMVANIGGFTGPLDQVDRRVNNSRQNIRRYGRDSAASLKSIATAITSVAGAAGLTTLVRNSLQATSEMQKMADMAGVNTTAFQELEYATSQYKVSQDALTDGLKELSLRAEEFVYTGAGPGKDAFERLGYSSDELNDKLKDTPALLSEIIDRMQGMEEAAQMRLADEIFGGQGGEQFVAVINGGSEALRGFKDEAHGLGLVMDESMIKASIKAEREVAKLGRVISGNLNQAVAAIAPDISDVAVKTTEWISANQELIGQKTHQYINDIKTASKGVYEVLSDIKGLYDSLPDSIKGDVGVGLAGAVLFGPKAGALIGAGAFLLGSFKDFFEGLEGLQAGKISWSDFIGDEAEFEASLARYREYKEKLEKENVLKFPIVGDYTAGGLQDRKPNHHDDGAGDEKLAAQQAAAWQAAYSSLDTMTQATYDKMMVYAQKEYEQNLKLLGDKETAKALHAQAISEINDKMYGEGIDTALDLYFGDVDDYAERYNELLSEGAQLTKEMRTPTEQLADKFVNLKELLDVGTVSLETYNRALSGMADESLGINNIFISDTDFKGQIDAENEQYEQRLELLNQYREERSELNAEWNEKEAELTQQHQDKLSEIEQARQELALFSASAMFGDMAEIIGAFAGESSGAYKAMFAVSKAFSVAEATINMFQAISEAGTLPYPANLAAMASVAAQMSTIVSSITSVGMAHDGIDSVPQTGTWILEKGERVTTAETSAKLDKTLESVQKNMSSDSVGYHINIPVSVSGGDSRFADTLSAEIENTVINVMRKEMR